MPKRAPAGDTRAGAFHCSTPRVLISFSEGRQTVARGKTSGAGRPKRTRTAPPAEDSRAKKKRPRLKRPARKAKASAAKVANDGASPVDIIIGMMRGDLPFDDARFKAAVAAAPYVHARRGTAEPADEASVRHEDALKELE